MSIIFTTFRAYCSTTYYSLLIMQTTTTKTLVLALLALLFFLLSELTIIFAWRATCSHYEA